MYKMGIVHELGEVYAGDYTPYDNITKEETKKSRILLTFSDERGIF